MSTTSWTGLGYFDRNGSYLIPCVKDFVSGHPGFRILWTQDSFGTYTLNLTCIGMPGNIAFPIHGSYKREECPPATLVEAVEARIIAAGIILFA